MVFWASPLAIFEESTSVVDVYTMFVQSLSLVEKRREEGSSRKHWFGMALSRRSVLFCSVRPPYYANVVVVTLLIQAHGFWRKGSLQQKEGYLSSSERASGFCVFVPFWGALGFGFGDVVDVVVLSCHKTVMLI